MTVAEAMRAATARLTATSDTARLDAELLMAHALEVSRSELLLGHMQAPEPAQFAALIDRRTAHEPVAYITGWTEFYGRTFNVAPGVLIPRGDSETLIEAAFAACPEPRRVLDLGTGSGALLLTVLAERPQASGMGIDQSDAALTIAECNAANLGIAGDWAFGLRDWREDGWADDLGTFDLVLCNPPYVEDAAALEPDVREYEPASALFAGKDGLDDYRVLIPQLRKLLNSGGIAIFEIGHTQAYAVTEIAQDCGFAVEIRKDLANRPRCALLR